MLDTLPCSFYNLVALQRVGPASEGEGKRPELSSNTEMLPEALETNLSS